jgi:hypothetical protein
MQGSRTGGVAGHFPARSVDDRVPGTLPSIRGVIGTTLVRNGGTPSEAAGVTTRLDK